MGMKLPPELERRVLELAGELPVRASAPVASRSKRSAVQPGPARVRLIVWIPGLVVRSEANIGGELRGKIARKVAIKSAVESALSTTLPPFAVAPVRVVLTRVGTRRMDDDNLANAFKPVRDVIAKWLGVDDGNRAAVRWVYRQRPGYVAGVRVAVG